MKMFRITAGVLAALASLGAGALVRAGNIEQSVHGRLSAEGVRTRAVYHISAHKNEQDRVKEEVRVEAKKLDTTRDDQGNPPDYHLWLVTKDGAESDFGFMFLNRGGNARLHFDSKHDAYPTGVTTVTSFGEGKIQIRAGATVVLEGTLPPFVKPGDAPTEGSETTIEDKSRLAPTATDSRSAGEVQARYRNNGHEAVETVKVRCQRMPGSASPYSVVAIAADSTVTELFTGLRPRSRNGEFHATLDTRGGYDIPGGGVLALSEQSVEVRDKDGNAVLTGKFPDMTIE
jgi:hypothetical protein